MGILPSEIGDIVPLMLTRPGIGVLSVTRDFSIGVPADPAMPGPARKRAAAFPVWKCAVEAPSVGAIRSGCSWVRTPSAVWRHSGKVHPSQTLREIPAALHFGNIAPH